LAATFREEDDKAAVIPSAARNLLWPRTLQREMRYLVDPKFAAQPLPDTNRSDLRLLTSVLRALCVSAL
jgi:hypothetical protein